ncbi:MAG: IclR family transcriptional regulator [Bradyrhizobium sp.]|nr:IclR family transcriptional regulator [Bradyrhizobium sp.]
MDETEAALNGAQKRVKRRAGRPRKRDTSLGIKAVEQGLSIVDILARNAQPSSLTELSAITGMNPGKLHRYLVSLCAKGIAKRHDTTGLYGLGPGAIALGLASLSRLDEFELVREAANELCTRFGQSTFVYVWASSGPVLVHNRLPPGALMNIRLGSVAPLVRSAVGPVFAAFLPPAVTEPILVRDAVELGIDPQKALRTAYQEVGPAIRRDRVFWADVSIMPDCSACAAPVFNASGELLCVLGISFALHGNLPSEQPALIEATAATAGSISSALGYRQGR